jgi:hypothetical protein
MANPGGGSEDSGLGASNMVCLCLLFGYNESFQGVPLHSKKIQVCALAVQNSIVIDVKVDNDLFLRFLKFYDDQNMLCQCTRN